LQNFQKILAAAVTLTEGNIGECTCGLGSPLDSECEDDEDDDDKDEDETVGSSSSLSGSISLASEQVCPVHGKPSIAGGVSYWNPFFLLMWLTVERKNYWEAMCHVGLLVSSIDRWNVEDYKLFF